MCYVENLMCYNHFLILKIGMVDRFKKKNNVTILKLVYKTGSNIQTGSNLKPVYQPYNTKNFPKKCDLMIFLIYFVCDMILLNIYYKLASYICYNLLNQDICLHLIRNSHLNRLNWLTILPISFKTLKFSQ